MNVKRLLPRAGEGRGSLASVVGMPLIFVIMVVTFTAINPMFLSFGNLSNLLYSSAANGIAVIGTAMVIMVGGLDISIASIMFGAGCVSVLMANKLGTPMPVTLLGAMATGLALGAINGFFISRFRIVPMLMTLATGSLYRGVMLYTINEGYMPFKSYDYTNFIINTKFLGLGVSVYIFLGLCILFQFVIKRTKFGWHLLAVGNNIEASKKVGINVPRIQFLVYSLNGLLGGLAGFVLVCMIGEISPSFANGNEFTMITAAVIGGVALSGGRGNILPGALLGTLLMFTIENGLNIISANPYAYSIVRGMVIFAAVALDSVKNSGEILR